MQSWYWILLWLLLFAGCTTTVPLSTRTPEADLTPAAGAPAAETPVLLDYGASAASADGELTVTFSEVVDDSRCPANVTCIVAGKVLVALDAALAGEPSRRLELGGATDSRGRIDVQLPARGTTSTGTIGNYELQLLAVTPYPVAAGPADVGKYQVQLLIRSN